MRINKFTVCLILICIGCLNIFILLSGCVSLSLAPVANGHVYIDGKVVSGAVVEAVAINGTDHQSTTTDNQGAYVLNIRPATKYNITATYQGLRHTVWPVYLPNKTDIYNINLTTTPRSTIEGTGYATSSDCCPRPKMIGFTIHAEPVKNNTTISTIITSDGSYSLKVVPNVLYDMNCTHSSSPHPVALFHYRNYEIQGLGMTPQIMVGPNETALVDYVIPVP